MWGICHYWFHCWCWWYMHICLNLVLHQNLQIFQITFNYKTFPLCLFWGGMIGVQCLLVCGRGLLWKICSRKIVIRSHRNADKLDHCQSSSISIIKVQMLRILHMHHVCEVFISKHNYPKEYEAIWRELFVCCDFYVCHLPLQMQCKFGYQVHHEWKMSCHTCWILIQVTEANNGAKRK